MNFPFFNRTKYISSTIKIQFEKIQLELLINRILENSPKNFSNQSFRAKSWRKAFLQTRIPAKLAIPSVSFHIYTLLIIKAKT